MMSLKFTIELSIMSFEDQKFTPTFCIKLSTLTLVVFNDKYITVYASTTPQIHKHISYFRVSFISFLYTCTCTDSFNLYTTMMTFKKSKQMAKIRQYINDALNSFLLKNFVQARYQKNCEKK